MGPIAKKDSPLIQTNIGIYQKTNKRRNPADTDVFKTSSRRLKKVKTSYDQTRRRHPVCKKTSHLRDLEDV